MWENHHLLEEIINLLIDCEEIISENENIENAASCYWTRGRIPVKFFVQCSDLQKWLYATYKMSLLLQGWKSGSRLCLCFVWSSFRSLCILFMVPHMLLQIKWYAQSLRKNGEFCEIRLCKHGSICVFLKETFVWIVSVRCAVSLVVLNLISICYAPLWFWSNNSPKSQVFINFLQSDTKLFKNSPACLYACIICSWFRRWTELDTIYALC